MRKQEAQAKTLFAVCHQQSITVAFYSRCKPPFSGNIFVAFGDGNFFFFLFNFNNDRKTEERFFFLLSFDFDPSFEYLGQISNNTNSLVLVAVVISAILYAKIFTQHLFVAATALVRLMHGL